MDGHGTGPERGDGHDEPGGHGIQYASPGVSAYDPGVHDVQATAKPTFGLAVPGAHSTGAESARGQYRPMNEESITCSFM